MLGCSWPCSPAQSEPAFLVWWGLYVEALNIALSKPVVQALSFLVFRHYFHSFCSLVNFVIHLYMCSLVG